MKNTFIDTPVVPSKTKDQNLYPFSDQNDAKTTPFGAAYTYVIYISPPPLPPHNYTSQTQTWIEGCIIWNVKRFIQNLLKQNTCWDKAAKV